jgi:hypothetical protein
MSFEQIASLIRDASLAIIFAGLWWTERLDRKASEKRERDYLRQAADIKGDGE